MTFVNRLLATLRREEDFLCALATVGIDGLPHVRYMKGVIDEHLTFASTQKVRHIQHCADVSLTCGDTDSRQPGSYFQITAQATITKDHDDRVAAWTSRMEKWFSGLSLHASSLSQSEEVRQAKSGVPTHKSGHKGLIMWMSSGSSSKSSGWGVGVHTNPRLV